MKYKTTREEALNILAEDLLQAFCDSAREEELEERLVSIIEREGENE